MTSVSNSKMVTYMVVHLEVMMNYWQCHQLIAHCRKLSVVAKFVHLLRQFRQHAYQLLAHQVR